MDVPILNTPKPAQPFGPMIRLLVCHDCKTVDELPDYDGNPADEHDDLMNYQIQNHHTDRLTGLEHRGLTGKVPVSEWAKPEVRKQTLEQFRTGAPGLAAVDEDFYDTRSTFFEDAGQCYTKHLRPQGRCPDWKIDSKKLVPNTAADRKEAGLSKPGKSGPSTYLCDFCPAKAYMVTRNRESVGMYD